jgi:hypothetical protein
MVIHKTIGFRAAAASNETEATTVLISAQE